MNLLFLKPFVDVKVRTCGKFMAITIGSMLEEVQYLYQQHNQSCFLYLSSEVIKVLYFCTFLFEFQLSFLVLFIDANLEWQMFGSDPSCANYLNNLIEALFIHTTKLLRTIQVLFPWLPFCWALTRLFLSNL